VRFYTVEGVVVSCTAEGLWGVALSEGCVLHSLGAVEWCNV